MRDHFVALIEMWLDVLRELARDAIRAGHLRKTVQIEPLVFELYALVLGANWSRQLFADSPMVEHMRTAMRRRLTEAASARGKRLLAAATRAKR